MKIEKYIKKIKIYEYFAETIERNIAYGRSACSSGIMH
jgi:hypothetical protein